MQMPKAQDKGAAKSSRDRIPTDLDFLQNFVDDMWNSTFYSRLKNEIVLFLLVTYSVALQYFHLYKTVLSLSTRVSTIILSKLSLWPFSFG